MEVRITNDVEKLIGSLQKKTVAKVLRTIDLLERFGHRLGMPHSRKIDGNLFELRVRGRQEVRIFYAIRNRQAILFHGFIKKSQKIPEKEISTVRRKMQLL